MSVPQYVIANRTRDETGAIVPIPAGYTLVSDEDGLGVWSPMWGPWGPFAPTVNLAPPAIPPAPIVNFAEFLQDNFTIGGKIAIGAPFPFATDGGPTSVGTTIIALSATRFQLGPVGQYRVSWQSSINEPGQMGLAMSDAPIPGEPVFKLLHQDRRRNTAGQRP